MSGVCNKPIHECEFSSRLYFLLYNDFDGGISRASVYMWINNIVYMFGLINWSYPRNAIVNDPLSIHDVGHIITRIIEVGF